MKETTICLRLPPDGTAHILSGRMAGWLNDFAWTEANPFVKIEAMGVTVTQILAYCEAKRQQLVTEAVTLLKHPALAVRETGELLSAYCPEDIACILELKKPMTIRGLVAWLDKKATLQEVDEVLSKINTLLYITDNPDLSDWQLFDEE